MVTLKQPRQPGNGKRQSSPVFTACPRSSDRYRFCLNSSLARTE
jgi:hypothetical protein